MFGGIYIFFNEDFLFVIFWLSEIDFSILYINIYIIEYINFG